MAENGNTGNHKTTALAQLLNKLDLPTIIIIVTMGGGNILAIFQDGRVTREEGRLTRDEAVRVSKEVHELYGQMENFEKRQKKTVELLENQQKILNDLQSRNH